MAMHALVNPSRRRASATRHPEVGRADVPAHAPRCPRCPVPLFVPCTRQPSHSELAAGTRPLLISHQSARANATQFSNAVRIGRELCKGVASCERDMLKPCPVRRFVGVDVAAAACPQRPPGGCDSTRSHGHTRCACPSTFVPVGLARHAQQQQRQHQPCPTDT